MSLNLKCQNNRELWLTRHICVFHLGGQGGSSWGNCSSAVLIFKWFKKKWGQLD